MPLPSYADCPAHMPRAEQHWYEGRPSNRRAYTRRARTRYTRGNVIRRWEESASPAPSRAEYTYPSRFAAAIAVRNIRSRTAARMEFGGPTKEGDGAVRVG